jgi:procollagen-lysine,2-oxoglutarate 5-dioxygenase
MNITKDNLIIISVATDVNNKGLQYFINSLKKYNIQYKILGLNTKWNGGDMKTTGGGQKINLLKKELKQWDIEKLKSTLLLFSDSYDAINLSNEEEIIEKYNNISKNKILFSVEKYCWPDASLNQYYPETKSKYKYLNSGGFIGNAYEILKLIKMDINDNDDDQLYFTKIFLFDNKNIKLDYNCEIFQTLNGSISDIYIYKNRILNINNSSIPSIIHGNGNSKEYLYKIILLFFDACKEKILC